MNIEATLRSVRFAEYRAHLAKVWPGGADAWQRVGVLDRSTET
jgi:hypothetical protein